MLFSLCALLLLTHVAFAIHPKPQSSLDQIRVNYPTDSPQTTTTRGHDDDDDDDDDDDNLMPNGFPVLTPRKKAKLEACIIDDYINDELSCGNNPFSGLCRLSFHDCATFDKTNTTNPGGCRAWMHKKCDDLNECEFTAQENNGLQPWVNSLDDMYDNARLNGVKLSKILSRPDFWHLAAHYAIEQSSGGNLNLTYFAGRFDPDVPKPRFDGRLPGAFAFSEMQRVASRNGMSDFSAAALLGAHTLGSAHPKTSGFQGSWDATPQVFDSHYWEVLLDEEWVTHQVQATNSLTGEQTTTTQYSLPGDNFDSSIMLFADVGQIVSDSANCNPLNDPTNTCQKSSTNSKIAGALRSWADTPSTFFSAFKRAYDPLSAWGCSNCVAVAAFSKRVKCGGNHYNHKCQPIYSKHYNWQKTSSGGWSSPTTQPPATQAPATQAPATQAPTTTARRVYP
jgi:hypothetical protein